MRIGTLVVVVWLLIGAFAGWQRGYYASHNNSCAHFGTIAVTVVAGPLNFSASTPRCTTATYRNPPSRGSQVEV